MKTVIEMAREAGAIPIHKDYKQQALVGNENIERFAELVRADEREACAMLAWSAVLAMTDADTADKMLSAIRVRSST